MAVPPMRSALVCQPRPLRGRGPLRRRLCLAAAACLLTPLRAWSGEVAYEAQRFESDLAQGRPTVLFFATDWCSTCSAEKAVLDELLVEPRFKELTIFVADFDQERELRRRYRVAVQSTFVVFKGGREVARATGLVRRDAIANLLAQAF